MVQSRNELVPKKTTVLRLLQVIKDIAAQINIMFLINHLSCTLKLPYEDVRKQLIELKNVLSIYRKCRSQDKIDNFKCRINQVLIIFTLRSAQWALLFREKVYFEQIHFSYSSLATTSSWTSGQQWCSKLPTTLSFILPIFWLFSVLCKISTFNDFGQSLLILNVI